MWTSFQKAQRFLKTKNDQKSIVSLTYPRLAHSLEFVDCPEIAAGLANVSPGWSPVPATRESEVIPFARIVKSRSGYEFHSKIVPPPDRWEICLEHSFDAIRYLQYTISDWFIDEHPGYLCLHAAAVQFDNGIVIFPSASRAGKTTFAIHCALAGYKVFSDDALAIDPTDQFVEGLGTKPRMRNPIPQTLNVDFISFIEQRGGLSGERYRYIDLTGPEIALAGEQASIIGFVNLERQEVGPTEISNAPREDILGHLIRRNYANNLSATEIFERILSLTTAFPCYTLNYADATEGVDIIAQEFSS
jgi:hypothetical protein